MEPVHLITVKHTMHLRGLVLLLICAVIAGEHTASAQFQIQSKTPIEEQHHAFQAPTQQVQQKPAQQPIAQQHHNWPEHTTQRRPTKVAHKGCAAGHVKGGVKQVRNSQVDVGHNRDQEIAQQIKSLQSFNSLSGKGVKGFAPKGEREVFVKTAPPQQIQTHIKPETQYYKHTYNPNPTYYQPSLHQSDTKGAAQNQHRNADWYAQQIQEHLNTKGGIKGGNKGGIKGDTKGGTKGGPNADLFKYDYYTRPYQAKGAQHENAYQNEGGVKNWPQHQKYQNNRIQETQALNQY